MDTITKTAAASAVLAWCLTLFTARLKVAYSLQILWRLTAAARESSQEDAQGQD